MPHGTRNKRFSTLKRIKTGGIQPKLNVACFVQSCFAVADFVIFSNYCLTGTRQKVRFFFKNSISVFFAFAYHECQGDKRTQKLAAREGVPYAVKLPYTRKGKNAYNRQHQRAQKRYCCRHRAVVERRKERRGIHIQPHHEKRQRTYYKSVRRKLQKLRIVADEQRRYGACEQYGAYRKHRRRDRKHYDTLSEYIFHFLMVCRAVVIPITGDAPEEYPANMPMNINAAYMTTPYAATPSSPAYFIS